MLSDNAKKLLEVLKTYAKKDGTIALPPFAELQQRMDGLHKVPLMCCFRKLVERGHIIVSPQSVSHIQS